MILIQLLNKFRLEFSNDRLPRLHLLLELMPQ